jgi:hypothetical protein
MTYPGAAVHEHGPARAARGRAQQPVVALVHVHARPDLRCDLLTRMRVNTAVRGVHLDAPGIVELQRVAHGRRPASAAGPPHAREQQENDDDAHRCGQHADGVRSPGARLGFLVVSAPASCHNIFRVCAASRRWAGT